MDFKIAIEQDEEGWYIVTVPALSGLASLRERPGQRRRRTLPKPSNCM
ncbi:type II toxin-antitoxin system HicB family antitoxin [Methanoregula sp.]